MQIQMNSKTVLHGVIGDPIAHSKSPLMMNRAFRELGLNSAYGAFHVTSEQLPAALAGVRALRMRGLNVTIPHKEAVIPLLDELDESAQMIGAVNTIVNDNGTLRGYNTDGIGYVRSLEEETGIDLAGKTVAVIGAGGAARAILYAFAKRNVKKIWIVNRTVARAEQLAQHFSAMCDVGVLQTEALSIYGASLDLLVNTTSVGMSPDVEQCPLNDFHWIDENIIISDLIYNPRVTTLLRRAAECGAKTHGGLGMLVYQGACAFEYWTGLQAPVQSMWQAVTE